MTPCLQKNFGNTFFRSEYMYHKRVKIMLEAKYVYLKTRAWKSDLVPPSEKILIPCLLPATRKIKKVPPKIWAWFLLSTGHHYYERKLHNECILRYSSTSVVTPEISQSYSNSVIFGDLAPSGAATLQRFLEPCLKLCFCLRLLRLFQCFIEE